MNSDGTTSVALSVRTVNTVHSKCVHNVAENTPYPTAVTVDQKRLAKMVSAALRILKDHEQNAQRQVAEVSG